MSTWDILVHKTISNKFLPCLWCLTLTLKELLFLSIKYQKIMIKYFINVKKWFLSQSGDNKSMAIKYLKWTKKFYLFNTKHYIIER